MTTKSTDLADALAEHRRLSAQRLEGSGELRVFFAPGRVNLMGAHLDYNGGPVMPTAIDRGTLIFARVRSDREVHLASALEEGEFHGSVDDLPSSASGAWFDYPLGVLRHRSQEGELAHGLDLFFGGNLPIGAGLSSSASICVGTAYALQGLGNGRIDLEACIASALWAEREFVGVHCGIMDPYAVGLARPNHLLWVDCKDGQVDHVPIDSDRLTIAVADSGVRRELAGSAFNDRVDQCARAFALLGDGVSGASCLRDVPREVVDAQRTRLGEDIWKRACHVTDEVERTLMARAALDGGDFAAFGRAMTASHDSLRDQFEVSIPELDFLVETAVAWPGVLGSRLTGAGFGGCIVILMETRACPGFAAHLNASYRSRFGRDSDVQFFQGDRGPRELQDQA